MVLINGGVRRILSLALYGSVNIDLLDFSLETIFSKRTGWAIDVSSLIYSCSTILAVVIAVIKLDREKLLDFATDSGLIGSKHLLVQVAAGMALGIAFHAVKYFGFYAIKSLIVLGAVYRETIEMSLKPYSAYESWLQLHTFLYIPIRIVLPAFAEEILFRAYVQRHMIEHLGVMKGILLATMLFVLGHLPGEGGYTDIIIFMMAMDIIQYCITGYLYHKGKYIYMMGTMHATNNAIYYVFF
ncbi:MAG: CAAX amino terminal protease self- immunity [Smithella sp. PtaU1.Bin162]|nr:MAG: CAAX amino terminal protease self- immunity [Smithella sp. PtaU1.Bin162]